MQMTHPFEKLTPTRQKRWLIALIILTVLVMAALNIIGIPLNTAPAPVGIVSFEFAGDLPTAHKMLNSWDHKAQIHAGLSLGFDYLFMVLYSTAIALACVMVTKLFRLRGQFLVSIGLLLAWGQWLAAILDGIENYALILLLLGSENPIWPAVAWWCAAPKFAIVLAGLIYTLLGALLALFRVFKKH